MGQVKIFLVFKDLYSYISLQIGYLGSATLKVSKNRSGVNVEMGYGRTQQIDQKSVNDPVLKFSQSACNQNPEI